MWAMSLCMKYCVNVVFLSVDIIWLGVMSQDVFIICVYQCMWNLCIRSICVRNISLCVVYYFFPNYTSDGRAKMPRFRTVFDVVPVIREVFVPFTNSRWWHFETFATLNSVSILTLRTNCLMRHFASQKSHACKLTPTLLALLLQTQTKYGYGARTLKILATFC